MLDTCKPACGCSLLCFTPAASISPDGPYIPCRGEFAQIKQRRLRRWLNNARINIHRHYKPLIQAALADWREECIYLSLDTSLFWNEYCLVRLAVVHRGRALPVVWESGKRKQQYLEN